MELQWSNDLGTAIVSVDDEHRELIECHRKLVDDLRGKVDLSQFSEDMEKLVENTRAHFLHEELIMRNLRYPKYGEHRVAHQRLVADLADLIGNIGVGFSDKDLPAVVDCFQYWFVGHVREHDVKLKQYLEVAGVVRIDPDMG